MTIIVWLIVRSKEAVIPLGHQQRSQYKSKGKFNLKMLQRFEENGCSFKQMFIYSVFSPGNNAFAVGFL